MFLLASAPESAEDERRFESQTKGEGVQDLRCMRCALSVERIIEYTTRHEPEAPAVLDNQRPPADWPQAGCIDFQDLKVRYRPNLPLVLKGLTFCIQPQEKVRLLAGCLFFVAIVPPL